MLLLISRLTRVIIPIRLKKQSAKRQITERSTKPLLNHWLDGFYRTPKRFSSIIVQFWFDLLGAVFFLWEKVGSWNFQRRPTCKRLVLDQFGGLCTYCNWSPSIVLDPSFPNLFVRSTHSYLSLLVRCTLYLDENVSYLRILTLTYHWNLI